MSAKPNYETMYILRPDIAEEEVESHANKYRDLVVEAGGEVIDSQMRGKRRLAYNIGKHREGIYIQLNYSGDGKQVGPLEKAMRLSEDVIRYLTVKYEGQHSSWAAAPPRPTPWPATPSHRRARAGQERASNRPSLSWSADAQQTVTACWARL